MPDQDLTQLIQDTSFLNSADKQFLLQSLASLTSLEKIKLKSSLTSNNPSAIIQNLQIVKAKIFQSGSLPNLNQSTNQNTSDPDTLSKSADKKEGFLEKLTSKLFPEPKPQVVSASVLTDVRYLGSNIPRFNNENVPPLQKLDDFTHPAQLKFLNVAHVSFGLNTNQRQILKIFFDKTEDIFDNIENIDIKRGYFMNYIQSSLFNNYLNTALTALRHQELQPREVVLNMMHQINPNNLNTDQFETAAEITSHLRSLVGI
jgi:hypothetical protein